MTMLGVDEQIRYLLQWFNEWSELQRSDFLPILSEKYSNKPYVNGIVNNIANVSCQEKPMSLFQCRVCETVQRMVHIMEYGTARCILEEAHGDRRCVRRQIKT
ncbi:hypothetical protein MML48_2g00000687 [Holotrichia oblita]|uniref:Uncharacterized protein n=1 Tax=Holotrichia oblita TaxID=644536 RepID=A0ACB9TQX0_HOLOL|nr:hypothetical protein MML48_2g00000687 [Holotrichia oblita]